MAICQVSIISYPCINPLILLDILNYSPSLQPSSLYSLTNMAHNHQLEWSSFLNDDGARFLQDDEQNSESDDGADAEKQYDNVLNLDLAPIINGIAIFLGVFSVLLCIAGCCKLRKLLRQYNTVKIND